MTPETEAKAVEMLQGFAGKIGQTVEYLWPRAVEYVAVEGAVYAVMGVIALVLLAVAAKWAWGAVEDAYDADAPRFGIALVVIIAVPVLLFGVIGHNTMKALAPEGYLIRELVTSVGK